MWTSARLVAEFFGFFMLLFLTRFLLHSHFIAQIDQECHVGGIAVDLLAYGVRFPFWVYAPNDYANGSLFNGLLAAFFFSLLGRNLLALKLVALFFSAAGALATLYLLRACLQEVGLSSRRARWAATTALVVAVACAPTLVTASSLRLLGDHTEGSAIAAILLALFAVAPRNRKAVPTAALWALVGFGLYLNKGTVLVIPLLVAAELLLASRRPWRLAVAFGGLAVGALPELVIMAQQRGTGWIVMASKAERGSHDFPYAFLDSVFTLADRRFELLVLWVSSLLTGIALLVRRVYLSGSGEDPVTGSANITKTPPVALALVVGYTCLHLAALSVMAQGAFSPYVMYGYPTLTVLFAVLVAWVCARSALRWGEVTGTAVATAAVALTLFSYRPSGAMWGLERISAIWADQAGAACSWRLAEGFAREHRYGLTTQGRTRDEHMIERCRSLSEPDQVLDCIGGIARYLTWRMDFRVDGEPPPGLSTAERRAYAWYYGTHRDGDTTPCEDFTSPDLLAECRAAVRIECLVYADFLSRTASPRGLSRPRCLLPEPPMDGYWAARRLDLLARAPAVGTSSPLPDNPILRGCRPVLDECYG